MFISVSETLTPCHYTLPWPHIQVNNPVIIDKDWSTFYTQQKTSINELVKLVCLKSLLHRRTLSDPAKTGKNNPHYRSGEGGFGGIHSMD